MLTLVWLQKKNSFKELLTSHKILCANFLEANYDHIFTHYIKVMMMMMTTEDYFSALFVVWL
jgi:hypothetical protein